MEQGINQAERLAAQNAYNLAVREAYNAAAKNTKITGAAKLKFEEMCEVIETYHKSIDEQKPGTDFLATEKKVDWVLRDLHRLAQKDTAVAEALDGCRKDIKKARNAFVNTLAGF